MLLPLQCFAGSQSMKAVYRAGLRLLADTEVDEVVAKIRG